MPACFICNRPMTNEESVPVSEYNRQLEYVGEKCCFPKVLDEPGFQIKGKALFANLGRTRELIFGSGEYTCTKRA